MGTHMYQLSIAGAVWSFYSPMEVEITNNCVPFLAEAEHSDFTISYRIGEADTTGEIKLSEGNAVIWKGHDYYRVERYLATANQAYSCYYLRSEDPFHIEGLIYPGKEEKIDTLEQLIDISDLEIQLLSIHAVSLHSSFVRYQNKAVLFTAPSGTGKSTQAALWEKYRDAEQINGDRTILRKNGGIWTGYGSPFSGTSGLFRNECAPVGIIVVLRQGSENTIRQLNEGEAFRLLYSECVIPRWNDKVHAEVVDLISQISEELPIVMLSCLPDEGAVDLLDRFIQEKLDDCKAKHQ